MLSKIKLISALLITSLLTLAAAQATEDAQSIMDAIIENLRGESVEATIIMTVTKDDRVTNYELKIYSAGEDKALIQVMAPPRDAGQAILNVEQNLFIYNPRLKRTLRLPPSGRSDSFLGSDLSYNDLSGDDYREDYSSSIIEQTDSTITLELIPGPQAPTPYGKLLFTADATTYAPLELVFYDQREQQVKLITFSEIVEANGKFIPTRFEVQDLLKENSSTVAVWQDYQFDVEIPESCFSQQALERGCR